MCLLIKQSGIGYEQPDEERFFHIIFPFSRNLRFSQPRAKVL